MSIKIYNAFRIKNPGEPWNLLWSLKDQALKNIAEKAKAYYLFRIKNVIYTEPNFEDDGDSELWRGRLRFVHNQVRQGVKENAGSMDRGIYDVHAAITVAPYEGRYYLRPFCDATSVLVGGCLDFLESHPDLEDYHYQNQTDRPEDVTEHEWELRARTWKGIFSHKGGYPNQLVLDISSALDWWRLDPHMKLASELQKWEVRLPSLEELALEELAEKSYWLPALKAVFEPGRIFGYQFEIFKNNENSWTARVRDKPPRTGALSILVPWVKSMSGVP